ncbi:hypothetical protein [Mycolicibacterium mageritense]
MDDSGSSEDDSFNIADFERILFPRPVTSWSLSEWPTELIAIGSRLQALCDKHGADRIAAMYKELQEMGDTQLRATADILVQALRAQQGREQKPGS